MNLSSLPGKIRARRTASHGARAVPARPRHPDSESGLAHSPSKNQAGGYLLIEALVYIGLLFAVMGVGYLAVDRCIDRSMVLRRSLDDLSAGLAAGERWRADVRASSGSIHLSTTNDESVITIHRPSGAVSYRFTGHAIWRKPASGSWSKILARVKSSEMIEDPRDHVLAYRWELELERRTKGITQASRITPLLSFTAAPDTGRAR
jgi:hypothetical protein